MEVQQQGILTLLKSAVTGEALVLPADFDLNAAAATINAHKIAPLVYEGALHCGVPQQHPVMQSLFQSSCRAIQINARQLRALDKLFAAFESAGIDYLPVKGCMMKAMYPKPELRLMGDADILIRQAQYDLLVPIMEQLGYRKETVLDYVTVWCNDALHVELHKSLFSSQEKDLHAYFCNVWAMAKVKEGVRYAMTEEDAFIYEVAHFAKHYRGTGIGCRHMVDLWVYLRCHPALDEAYIQEGLEKLQLWTFYQHVRRTIAWWFEDAASDDKTELIGNVIFSNGNWGTKQTIAVAEGIMNHENETGAAGSRIAYIWRRLFPKAEKLQIQYPVLERAPWLLPVCWLRYLIRKILTHKLSLRQHMVKMRYMTDDNLENQRRMLREVGL